MFFSNQLLARKAPLGQIWMAATMRAKFNRRKLNKLDIIQICEEILNPPVPMALRLSGILMGGVVIVYERKVKLVYDDATRFMLEMKTWKTKSEPDPTVLPKRKHSARVEDVTLHVEEEENLEMGDVERGLHFSNNAAAAAFQHTSFLNMGLEDIGEAYININPGDENLSQEYNHHQADIENITLVDDFKPYKEGAGLFNQEERFDSILEDEDPATFTRSEYQEVPTFIPSPTEEGLQDEIQAQQGDPSKGPQSDEVEREQRRKYPTRRGAKRRPNVIIMDEQTIILSHVYQTWIGSTSDIVSRRGRKILSNLKCPPSSMKTSDLIGLQPAALIYGLANLIGEVNYQPPCLNLSRNFTHPQTSHSSPSARISTPPPPDRPSPSATETAHPRGPTEFNGIFSQKLEFSLEKGRPAHVNMQQEDVAIKMHHLVTPGSSGGSIHSSASGHNSSIQMDADPQLPLDRSKKRPSSSSRSSTGGLDPLYEEIPWEANGRGDSIKLRRIHEDVPTPEMELLEETGPTQTPMPLSSESSVTEVTRVIQTHLKSYFDAPGGPQVESLNQLATGMNAKRAAQLFYHTCILATNDFLKVEQKVAYGDIYISRGKKM